MRGAQGRSDGVQREAVRGTVLSVQRRPSLSVVVPARNEEGNLKACIETVSGILADLSIEHEIIVVNDGSTDGTAALAERLATEVGGMRVVHHHQSEGFAASYRDGANLATKDYVALIPGDNEIQPMSVRAAFEAIGTADVVVPVTVNQEDRPWLRRTLSLGFTATANTLFGLDFRYFQGPTIYPTSLLQRLPTTTRGFVFLAEMLVRAVTSGHTAVQVPMYIQARRFGSSRAVSLQNFVTALKTLAVLFWDVRVRRRPLR